MASQGTLYNCTLELLEKFCRSSCPEMEMNYSQRQDDGFTLQSTREACSTLRYYIHEKRSSFYNAVREIPSLEKTLYDFLWL
jgi:hypothetical protein